MDLSSWLQMVGFCYIPFEPGATDGLINCLQTDIDLTPRSASNDIEIRKEETPELLRWICLHKHTLA